jgi:hypothetical protein
MPDAAGNDRDDFAVFPRAEVARMAERLRVFLEEAG